MSSIIPPILPNPDLGFKVIVTKEEFNLFHNIDRQLFIRLVVELGREISESINVMAFLMCIEMISKEFNLVAKILQHWPNVMLNRLADEAVFILDCIVSSPYPNDCVREKKFPLIQHILHHNATFEFFHEKRLELITDVTKFINEVCIRAFTDIIEHVIYNGVTEQQELYRANLYGTASLPTHMLPQAAYYTPNDSPMVPQEIDDRTLFITFSKGYPVSENELRYFFSRSLSCTLLLYQLCLKKLVFELIPKIFLPFIFLL